MDTNNNLCACGKPFNQTDHAPHVTQYDEIHGAFPLAEPCWAKLTPDQRQPFYLQHCIDARLGIGAVKALMQALADGK